MRSAASVPECGAAARRGAVELSGLLALAVAVDAELDDSIDECEHFVRRPGASVVLFIAEQTAIDDLLACSGQALAFPFFNECIPASV